MPSAHFKRAGLFTLFVSFFILASWGFYLHQRFYEAYIGISVSNDDYETLWAHTRDMVYETADQETIFIGSSRMRFDMDIPTWQRLKGEHAVHLAPEDAKI